MSHPFRTLTGVIVLMLLTLLTACHKTEGDVDLPSDARNFIYKYFPLAYISSEEELPSGDFKVKITNGPTLIFDSEGGWTQLLGNGETLPEMIAFDYFPEPLYDYVDSLEQLNAIYSITRNERQYDVLLFQTRLIYDISTGRITETE